MRPAGASNEANLAWRFPGRGPDGREAAARNRRSHPASWVSLRIARTALTQQEDRPMKACWMTIAAVVLCAAAPSAQWIKYPTPGMPRTADGKPNLSAPAPKGADGKPDLSGL